MMKCSSYSTSFAGIYECFLLWLLGPLGMIFEKAATFFLGEKKGSNLVESIMV